MLARPRIAASAVVLIRVPLRDGFQDLDLAGSVGSEDVSRRAEEADENGGGEEEPLVTSSGSKAGHVVKMAERR